MNTRCIQRGLKGVNRYLQEILDRFPHSVERICPRRARGQLLGQAWVQTYLPLYARGQLLWSPTGVGPLITQNQVLTIHDISPIEYPEWYTYRYASWMRAVLPLLVKRVKKIITVSRYTKQRIVDIFSVKEQKIRVIYNGLSGEFSPQSKGRERDIREKLGVPSDKYVLSVGTISPRKNTERLLKAWRRALEVINGEYWLLMVGERGPAHGSMDLSIPDRVLFTGYVEDEDLPSLYSGATAFVYPSLYEGFGLPPLEAMASGTPPIVSDRTSLPEIVGNAGVLVNPLDVDDIAEGILRILQNEGLAVKLREKGLRRAGQFGWDESAHKTWEVLKEEAMRLDYSRQ